MTDETITARTRVLSESEIDILSIMYHAASKGDAIGAIPDDWAFSIMTDGRSSNHRYSFGMVIPGLGVTERVHASGRLVGGGETPMAAIRSFLGWFNDKHPTPGIFETPEDREDAWKREAHEAGEVPCVTRRGHRFVVSDENEEIAYCERCGCGEY